MLLQCTGVRSIYFNARTRPDQRDFGQNPIPKSPTVDGALHNVRDINDSDVACTRVGDIGGQIYFDITVELGPESQLIYRLRDR